RTACERAKRTLSSTSSTTLEIDSLFDGIDFSSQLSRARFEELCSDLFEKTLKPVEKVLRDAELDKGDVHEVVLVGGSTRIPRVQKLVSDFFNGKKPNSSINPDEAVAYGAAVQAAILTNVRSEQTNDLILIDVAPLSLGIEVVGGIMSRVIDRNSTVPTKKSDTFTTNRDNQTTVPITIFEGERKRTKDNNRLGEFNLNGLAPAKKGTPQVEVTFTVDANGILNVSAEDKSTGKTNQVTITNDRGRLSKADIDRMVAEAEEYKAEDEAAAERIAAKNSLESFTYDLRSSLDDLSGDDRTTLSDKIEETSSWLDRSNAASKEEYVEMQEELQEVARPILARKSGGGAGAGAGASGVYDMDSDDDGPPPLVGGDDSDDDGPPPLVGGDDSDDDGPPQAPRLWSSHRYLCKPNAPLVYSPRYLTNAEFEAGCNEAMPVHNRLQMPDNEAAATDYVRKVVDSTEDRDSFISGSLGGPILRTGGKFRLSSTDEFTWTSALLCGLPPRNKTGIDLTTPKPSEFFESKLKLLGSEGRSKFHLQALVLFTLLERGAPEKFVDVALERLRSLMNGHRAAWEPVLGLILQWAREGVP
ncbi:hypothetical protein P7C70_g6232, partial [Phenoliferia sp. Uapishka_3]